MSDMLEPITGESLWTATRMLVGFIGLLFLGARFLPGLEREGYPLPDGTRKRYSLTGMSLFFMAHVAVGVATFGYGVSLTPIVTHFWSLFAVANVIAIATSLALWVHGRRAGAFKLPHPEGNSLPEGVKDMWFGAEANPTLFGVDLKMFMYQPSLIGLDLVVVAFAYAQYERHGVVTPQMQCLLGFWLAYLFTHYVKEEFMLSTWDVHSENFGFMLVWGDLVYVPFLYSLPGWWLVDQVQPMAPWAVAALTLFHLLMLWVFREANWQKERYKQDRTAPIWGKVPEAIDGRLLVSGFWGLGRKINYTGEIGVYLSLALTTGFESPYPYLLPLSLTVLLTQRAARDDKKCRAKYGELWARYCGRVRFRMVPFLY